VYPIDGLSDPISGVFGTAQGRLWQVEATVRAGFVSHNSADAALSATEWISLLRLSCQRSLDASAFSGDADPE